MINVIIFALTSLVLTALVISYGLAYRIKPTLSVLSIFLFILSVWLRSIFLAFKISIDYLGMDTKQIDGENFRSIFILLTGLFFLYTTWKQNKE